MSRPGPDGFIRSTGASVGGHAYTLIGASRERGAFRILNSWGRSWGERGRAWISGEDLQHLVDGGNQGGELRVALERPLD